MELPREKWCRGGRIACLQHSNPAHNAVHHKRHNWKQKIQQTEMHRIDLILGKIMLLHMAAKEYWDFVSDLSAQMCIFQNLYIKSNVKELQKRSFLTPKIASTKQPLFNKGS